MKYGNIKVVISMKDIPKYVRLSLHTLVILKNILNFNKYSEPCMSELHQFLRNSEDNLASAPCF